MIQGFPRIRLQSRGASRSRRPPGEATMPIFESKKARAKEAKIAEWKQSAATVLATLKIPHDAIARLERELQGTLALPDDAAYKADEKNWNPAFHEKPALIAF